MVDKEIIYLVMGNVGEHGVNEAMLEYSEYLAAKYNILVHDQSPRSPKTNMLNLGAWMSMQSKVENITAAKSNNTMLSLGPSRKHHARWRLRKSPIYGIAYLMSCIS